MQRFSTILRPLLYPSSICRTFGSGRSLFSPRGFFLTPSTTFTSTPTSSLQSTIRWFTTTGEDISQTRKKLMYRSNHRGMRENDLILGSFAETYLSSLSSTELAKYSELLDELDPELFLWFTGKIEPPPEWANNDIFLRVQKHALSFAQKNK